jgi:YVTN family beta-propeller protein
MKTMFKTLLFFVIGFACTMPCFAQTSGYTLADTIVLGGGNRWDYLSVDRSTDKLFVSHGTSVNAVDLKTNKPAGEITGLAGTHGIAYASKSHKGYISCGGDNSVVVFDLATLQVLKKIAVGKKPDAIIFEPFTKTIIVMNGDSKDCSVISPDSDVVIATIKLDGGPEFAASDHKGRLFVNLEEENAVNVIDLKEMKVIAQWSLAPCKTPTGLAIDLKARKLFVGCRSKHLAVVDIDSGKVVKTFPIGAGVDACAYDEGTNLVFTSNGEGNISVFKVVSANDIQFVENIPTAPKARTMAVDKSTHKLYTSTILPSKNAFGVLVLEKK